MVQKIRIRSALFLCAALTFVAAAQAPETYKGRLSPVPVDAKLAPDTTGQGSASASLSGKRLTVTGTFEGLRGAATTAQLRLGAIAGVPGPALFDLTATQAASGSISGSGDLTGEQIAALRKNRLYVQLQSEKAPEGNLWGWLFK